MILENSYVQLKRSPSTSEILLYPKAFALLSLIAVRARRTEKSINPLNLKLGEALVGDYKSCGLTRAEYRNALKKLQKLKIITTLRSPKGTIARLIDKSIYDLNIKGVQSKEKAKFAKKEPLNDHQETTNKKNNNYSIVMSNENFDDMMEIVNYYRENIKSSAGFKGYSITLDLLEVHTKESLLQSIDNYAQQMSSEIQYRKSLDNFFDQDNKFYESFLPENFVNPGKKLQL